MSTATVTSQDVLSAAFGPQGSKTYADLKAAVTPEIEASLLRVPTPFFLPDEVLLHLLLQTWASDSPPVMTLAEAQAYVGD